MIHKLHMRILMIFLSINSLSLIGSERKLLTDIAHATSKTGLVSNGGSPADPIQLLIYYAEENLCQDMTDLIESGDIPDINACGRNGLPALCAAAAHGCDSSVQLLIEKKANIESKDACGHTPLHSAAAYGHASTAKLLLEAKAPVDALNKKGLAPIDIVGNGCLDGWTTMKAWNDVKGDCMRELIKQGATVNKKDKSGFHAPIDFAIDRKNLSHIQQLVAAKALLSRATLLRARCMVAPYSYVPHIQRCYTFLTKVYPKPEDIAQVEREFYQGLKRADSCAIL